MTNDVQIVFFGCAADFANAPGSVAFQKIAPYCDAPQTDGSGNAIIQRFNMEGARRLVAAFKENVRKLSGKGIGSASVPVYYGHPDHANASDGARDTEIYARVEALEARSDGLWAKLRKFPLLEKLKASAGRLEISPRWLCFKAADGTFQPAELLSLGLVARGNLPGAAVINSIQTTNNKQKTMDEQTMQKLAEMLGCEANAEAIFASVEQMKAKVADAESVANDAKKQADAEKEKAECEAKKLAAANARISELEAEKAKQAEDLANARNAEIKRILDDAHTAGKFEPAQREFFENALKQDFANGKAIIDAIKPADAGSAVNKIEAMAGAGKKTFEALANAYWGEQRKAGRMITLAEAIDEFKGTQAGIDALNAKQ